MKKTIYMNEPLEQLAEQTKGDSRRNGGFSRRLGEIVERFQIIKDLTILPEFSDTEVQILSECLCGSLCDTRKIRGLHLDVLDATPGSADEKQALSEKIGKMSPAERIILFEKYEQ